ncbi:MAG: pseudouridine synthase [Candidatus Deferrimicrobiaceae bacterium]
MPTDRLNRYISRAAGVSRRTADEMIRKGRVTVGGKRELDPGFPFDPFRSEVRLDGNLVITVQEEKIYLLANKPDSVVTTMSDKEGRKTAASLVGELSSRVYPVGRLDYHTTGLLLFTNDGDLAYKLTHPRFGVEKTYVAKMKGVPTPGKLDVLRRGLPIEGVLTNPAKVTFLEAREGKAWVSIRIAEGRHHQVRKMFEAIGYRVMKLRRVAIGPQELVNVEPGDWRYLTGKEVRDLFAYVEQKEREAAQAPKARKGIAAAPPKPPRPAGPPVPRTPQRRIAPAKKRPAG